MEDKREMIQFWSGWIKGVWVEEEEEGGGVIQIFFSSFKLTGAS